MVTFTIETSVSFVPNAKLTVPGVNFVSRGLKLLSSAGNLPTRIYVTGSDIESHILMAALWITVVMVLDFIVIIKALVSHSKESVPDAASQGLSCCLVLQSNCCWSSQIYFLWPHHQMSCFRWTNKIPLYRNHRVTNFNGVLNSVLVHDTSVWVCPTLHSYVHILSESSTNCLVTYFGAL